MAEGVSIRIHPGVLLAEYYELCLGILRAGTQSCSSPRAKNHVALLRLVALVAARLQLYQKEWRVRLERETLGYSSRSL